MMFSIPYGLNLRGRVQAIIGITRDPCEVCGDQAQLPQVRVPSSPGVKRILQMTAVARDVPATKACALPAIS